MLGISAIASYIPPGRHSNMNDGERFAIDEDFLLRKIGVLERAVKPVDVHTSDLAERALSKLFEKTGLDPLRIQVLVVITQNPDQNIPHIAAIVHGRTGLSKDCAAFDISLGCSGYVYGLSILKGFMESNSLTVGVLVTADPYSDILDSEDRNTALLFGDAATATLMTTNPVLKPSHFTFGTNGQDWRAIRTENGKLVMDGRGVFNFAAITVPSDIHRCLETVGISMDMIDLFILHQGSRYLVRTIAQRLREDLRKFPIELRNQGNTVSSSIPLVLEHTITDSAIKRLVLSGFGAGLSWASCFCQRIEI